MDNWLAVIGVEERGVRVRREDEGRRRRNGRQRREDILW